MKRLLSCEFNFDTVCVELKLLFFVPHDSKCHFLKWKSAATAALSAHKRNGRTLSMAAKPFILTIDSVCP